MNAKAIQDDLQSLGFTPSLAKRDMGTKSPLRVGNEEPAMGGWEKKSPLIR